MERQSSIDINNSSKEPDTDSNDGASITNNSTSGRRALSAPSICVKRPSYLTLDKGIDKRATTMKFPVIPNAFPKAPPSGEASFPSIPKSAPPSENHKMFCRVTQTKKVFVFTLEHFMINYI